MTRYCIYCGRALEENEQCNCSQALSHQTIPTNNQPQQEDEAQIQITNDETMLQAENEDIESISTPETETENEPAQSTSSTQTENEPVESITIQTDENQQQQNNQYTTRVHHSSKLAISLKNLFPFLHAYIKAPMSTVRMAIQEKDTPIAWVTLCLYLLTLMGTVLSCFNSVTRFISDVLSSSRLLSTAISSIRIHTVVIMLATLGSAALAILFTTLFLFLVSRILHSTLSFHKIFIASATTYIYPFLCCLLCMLFGFLSAPVAALLLPFALLSHLILLFLTAKTIFQVSEDSRFTIGMLIGIFLMSALCFVTVLRINVVMSRFMVSVTSRQSYFNQGPSAGSDEDSSNDLYDYYFGH